VILIYHGPTARYGRALANLIGNDTRLPENVRIITVGDQDLMNTLVYCPQVKCVVIALTTWEKTATRMIPSLQWYFDQGGGIVGLGNVGKRDVTKNLSTTVFPVNGTDYGRGKVERIILPDGTRKIVTTITYKKDEAHEVSKGLPNNFTVKDTRFVMSTNRTTKRFLPFKPETGEYKVLYRDGENGAPLVIAYEENGTSITFCATDQISEEPGPTYYQNFLQDDNFKKLLRNAVYYAYSQETKFEGAMKKAVQGVAKMQEENEKFQRMIDRAKKEEKTRRVLKLTALIAVSAILTTIISYYCFVVPARIGKKMEEEERERC